MPGCAPQKDYSNVHPRRDRSTHRHGTSGKLKRDEDSFILLPLRRWLLACAVVAMSRFVNKSTSEHGLQHTQADRRNCQDSSVSKHWLLLGINVMCAVISQTRFNTLEQSSPACRPQLPSGVSVVVEEFVGSDASQNLGRKQSRPIHLTIFSKSDPHLRAKL
eukprot:549698-Amphidinium_carterae.1